MFGKKNSVDVKRSTVKLQDPKKDLATRTKHLKIIVENSDLAEAKGLFEANFSHIYNLLYDSFIQTESNLRQRELSFHLVHKAHKEELETTLWILEQILCLLPELIHKRWQLHSLGRLLSKLLHPGNALKLRKQAIRFFLMWYQALNDNAPEYVHQMFAGLVPGFFSAGVMAFGATPSTPSVASGGASVFHDTSAQQPIIPGELLPILPPSSGEKTPDHPSKFYLDVVLEQMVQTVVKLEWHDRGSHHHRCFNFLLERFKMYYMPKICPSFCETTSVYRPNLDLPVLRKLEGDSEFVYCRVSLVMWVANHMHQTKKSNDLNQNFQQHSHVHVHPQEEDAHQHESAHASLDSAISGQTNKTTTDEELAHQIVRDVLCSTRDNVNFIHEIYRQAFLLNFTHVLAVRKIITVYKDLVQGNLSELPPFALEPPEDPPREDLDPNNSRRLRNDSYLGAIHKENLLVRAGMQNLYQLFMTHAANVFMLEGNPHLPKMLEEQTDTCKRVLNIYRYMVMNTRMDSSTWEQLLLVLLQITSLVLGDMPPKKKSLTLGGKLAQAIFQTLIVTWIKANLNVMISRELWDRFLNVLTSLTSWEELIKEWAKTLETLTRVLARQVYNLDLNDLPLDRLNEHKSKRGRKVARPESNVPLCGSGSDAGHPLVCRQDSCLPDGHIASKRIRSGLTRSYSETSLAVKRRTNHKHHNPKHRRSRSLETVNLVPDTESTDRTRSPSPAPSSGLESNSIKDSPMQLDMLGVSETHSLDQAGDEHRGVVCGGSVRGWLPDVAVILWRRMLGALGDVNTIADARLHAQVFDYLIKLTCTLIKIKQNQGVSPDNQCTPQAPELVPPITLIVPWCFGALMLPETYEAGRLNALKLLGTITLNCDGKYNRFLGYFYRFIHIALCGQSKNELNATVKTMGPRFLSLQLPGSSLLLLDLVHACNVVLNDREGLEKAPRTEAVQILANLLSVPDDLSAISVLRPEEELSVVNCPDIKEHVVSILLRAGRHESTGKARFIALSSLGMFVYKEVTNQTFHAKVPEAINVILLSLRFNNKTITHLASNILFLLCDHATLLWSRYPRQGNAIICTLCSALFWHAPMGQMGGESDKVLGTALLLCLGEWCMKLGATRLLEISEYGQNRGACLLLEVFKVLHKVIIGKTSTEHASGGLTQPSISDDFDPNILSDDLLDKVHHSSGSPSKSTQCQLALKLCAKTVLSHLVTHLGHFPMAIGAARLSSLVVEHDDVPNMVTDDLSANIFSAPNIQLFILTQNVIASLVELPALDLPGGGVTAGLSTADKQVRVLLRDLSGKACWDASILYRTPCSDEERAELEEKREEMIPQQMTVLSQQPESLMVGSHLLNNLPQRAMRHRPPNVLPEVGNAAQDLDQLDDLLQYLGHTSPECLEEGIGRINEPAAPMFVELEQEAIGSVISQRNIELEESRYTQHMDWMLSQPMTRPSSRRSLPSVLETSVTSFESSASQTHYHLEQNAFQQCRLLFSQLGLGGWEKRQQLHLLNKTEKLLRELRNLDGQSCRETHKVAVIYVAPGQEDKGSIFANQGGSAAYEQFLAALAWEIELEGHTGFLGGLQRQGSTGLTAPYVASSFLESIFHVSTRMPSDTPEAILSKTRHLGNDEVHIVWSEHSRDYRRDIIPTEFCDILITIYPLGNNLNRITVDCKPDVPNFGILFNEAIVETNVLAGLVRATAICASRAKRSTYDKYQQYYEERARSLDTVITKHKHITTFEDFIARIYSPMPTSSPFYAGNSTANSSIDGASCNSSTLAAALLDSSHSHPHKNRIDSKFRASTNDAASAAKNVWFNNSDLQNVESSISPRPHKKLAPNLKNSRRSLRQEMSVESPPESPQQMIRRK